MGKFRLLDLVKPCMCILPEVAAPDRRTSERGFLMAFTSEFAYFMRTFCEKWRPKTFSMRFLMD